MTIGVCDVNPDETQRTVYFLRSQIKNNIIDNENVRFVSYNLDSVMLDIDYQKFDCDIFITELLYPNGKNGVNLAKRINAVAPSCKILFYVKKIPEELDIYEANHVNCMLKGRHDARLVTFMNDLVEKMNNDDKKQFIKIRYDRNVNILDCRDIMYIKIENRVTIYYTNRKNDQRDGKYYEYRPLSEIMKELPDNFVRCSAAAVVNRDYISNYNHQTVTMVDGEEIKIGRRYGDVNENRKEKVVQ